MQFNELEVSHEWGLPVYAIKDGPYFDTSKPRLKINSNEFIYLNGPYIGNRSNEGQTAEVVFVKYLHVGAQLG